MRHFFTEPHPANDEGPIAQGAFVEERFRAVEEAEQVEQAYAISADAGGMGVTELIRVGEQEIAVTQDHWHISIKSCKKERQHFQQTRW